MYPSEHDGFKVPFMAWAPVTVVEPDGRRHSMDVLADSVFDAAHLYFTTARGQRGALMPTATPLPAARTVFEAGRARWRARP